MGKKNRKPSGKKSQRSSLKDHKLVGKTLIPPMVHRLGSGLHFSSWMNQRLPEYLWVSLLLDQVPRTEALGMFKKILHLCLELRRQDGPHPRLWGINHSSITELPPTMFERLVDIITSHPNGASALSPLLLLDTLPGKSRWEEAIGLRPSQADFIKLQSAVTGCLDHQSIQSTDIRWLSVMFIQACGRLHFADHLLYLIEELNSYPELTNENELARASASIRSMETGFGNLVNSNEDERKNDWSAQFWNECLLKTDCIGSHTSEWDDELASTVQLYDCIAELRGDLYKHWNSTVSQTSVDARHDTSFGIAFYCLDLLDELSSTASRHSISGRLLVRVITECRVSLAFLRHRDDPSLWDKFRKYGTGQAKLALLKIQSADHGPSLVSQELLDFVANEDFYEEFVSVELGHWCNMDLRKMAEQSGTKPDYDRYYGWASTFVHGQWAAIRVCNFETCLNPLHRLHRIPRSNPRILTDAAPGGFSLVDSVLLELNHLYPGFQLPNSWSALMATVGDN